MGKHVLLVVVELVTLLIVATQAHQQNLRERSSSSSSGTSSSMVSSHGTINAGDPTVVPPPDPAVHLRSSSSIHDVNLIDTVTGYTDFQSTFASSVSSTTGSAAFSGFTTSSKSIDNTIHIGSISGTSSSDEIGVTEEDAASSASSQSESERASVSTTDLSYSSQSTSTTTSSSDKTSQSSSTPSSFDIFEDGSSYSVGTVLPNEERSDIESTKLELSTSHEAASSHSSRSSKKATSTTDPAASSIQDGDDASKNNSTKDLTSSSLSSRNPILYACVVLAVAGLAGGIFAFRAKRKHDDEWIVSEPSASTPPPRRDPPPSQVRVIINDNHFALL